MIKIKKLLIISFILFSSLIKAKEFSHKQIEFKQILKNCNIEFIKFDETEKDVILIKGYNNYIIKTKAVIDKYKVTLYFKKPIYGKLSIRSEMNYPWFRVKENSIIAEIDIKNDSSFDFLWFGLFDTKKKEVFLNDLELLNKKDKKCTVNTFFVFSNLELFYNNFIQIKKRYSNYEKFYHMEISNPNRYIAYLKKYPLSKETEAKYTQISVWLLETRLYNEALLLAVNLIQYNKKNEIAYIVAGDSYFLLNDRKKAKKYYNKLLTLAKQNKGYKTKIPTRVFKRSK